MFENPQHSPPKQLSSTHPFFLIGENGRQEANLERFEVVSQ